MERLLAIAVGGALGALLRYGVGTGVDRWLGRDFPWGILLVNVSGSVAMGAAYALLVERELLNPALRAVLMVGLLGAFTTFSTFSLDTVHLLERGEALRALVNVTAGVLLCVGDCWAGLLLARQLLVELCA